MITVSKFGSFFLVLCHACAWISDPASSWQEAEHRKLCHVCDPVPVLRIEFRPPVEAASL